MFSVWLCSAGPLWTAFRLLRAISRVQTLNIIDGSPRRSSVSPQRSPVPAIGSTAEPRGTSKRPPDLVITATMRLRREHLPDGDTVRISHRGVPVVASMLPIMFSGSFAEMALSGRNAALGCFDEHNRPLNIEARRRDGVQNSRYAYAEPVGVDGASAPLRRSTSGARSDRDVAQALASHGSPGARNRSSGAVLADARLWAKPIARCGARTAGSARSQCRLMCRCRDRVNDVNGGRLRRSAAVDM
jgi:hypothetical protein